MRDDSSKAHELFSFPSSLGSRSAGVTSRSHCLPGARMVRGPGHCVTSTTATATMSPPLGHVLAGWAGVTGTHGAAAPGQLRVPAGCQQPPSRSLPWVCQLLPWPGGAAHTLHPIACTLHPTSLHTASCTLASCAPASYTLHPGPYTLLSVLWAPAAQLSIICPHSGPWGSRSPALHHLSLFGTLRFPQPSSPPSVLVWDPGASAAQVSIICPRPGPWGSRSPACAAL